MMQKFVPAFVPNFGVRGFLLFFLCALLLPKSAGAQQPALNLLPVPASVQAGIGSLRVDSSFSVALTGHTETRLERAVERLLKQLARKPVIPLKFIPANTTQVNFIDD